MLSTFSGLVALLLSGGIQAQQKNVLFIAVDDLRPELGCYGHPIIKSPNIDRLAASGVRFTQAYCNIPVCGATRASILSGLRPNASRFVNFDCYLDKDVPGVVSLPMHFRNNGYHTVSLGKIFHHQDDSKGSWDTNWRPQNPKSGMWQDYQLQENIEKNKGNRSFALRKSRCARRRLFRRKNCRESHLRTSGREKIRSAVFYGGGLPETASAI